MNKRRDFLKSIAAGSITLAFPAIIEAKKNKKKPNILLAISDDQSWEHTSINGCKFAKTPAFDRMAKEGILFNHAFCPAPQCSPSRAALLTGRNIWQNDEAGVHGSYFPSKFKTYPFILEKEAGYFKGYTTKGWGPGNFKDTGWKGNPAGGKAYDSRKLKPPAKGIKKNDYAKNFEDFLAERPKDQPFCYWYGCKEPHRKYEYKSGVKHGKNLKDARVPDFYPDVEEIRHDLLDYAFEIEWFDKHLGKMIKKLEEIGELDNTIIVVTADNGMPFPYAKANLYEHGTHAPMAIRWANKIKPNRVVDDFISFIDLAPTFLEAAGLKIDPQMTGKSMMNIFSSNKSGWIEKERNFALTGRERHTHARKKNHTYPVRAIRTKDYLFILNFKPDRWPAGAPEKYHDIDSSPSKSYLMNKIDKKSKLYRLSFGKRPEEELYQIKSDHDCVKNLAYEPKYKKIKLKLRTKLEKLLKEQKDPRMLGYGDIFESYPRVSKMRPELGGFAKRGEYNPEYVKKAFKDMKKAGLSKSEAMDKYAYKEDIKNILANKPVKKKKKK